MCSGYVFSFFNSSQFRLDVAECELYTLCSDSEFTCWDGRCLDYEDDCFHPCNFEEFFCQSGECVKSLDSCPSQCEEGAFDCGNTWFSKLLESVNYIGVKILKRTAIYVARMSIGACTCLTVYLIPKNARSSAKKTKFGAVCFLTLRLFSITKL